MFNAEQTEHMVALAEVPPEERHWCGWYRLYEYHPHPDCPEGLTARDRNRQSCECCGGSPNPHLGRLIHTAGCTAAYRAEHYAHFDMGDPGA